MAKEPTVNLSCSFCGKTQREVKKLIAGPGVYICDECIGLCIDVIGEEVSSSDTPLAVERCLAWETERVKTHTDGLVEIATVRAAEIPVHVRLAVSRLAEALGAAQTAMGAWTPAEGPLVGSALPAWVPPVLKRLSSIEEIVAALRLTLERTIPAERLTTLDHVLQELSLTRNAIDSGARAARPSTNGEPS